MQQSSSASTSPIGEASPAAQNPRAQSLTTLPNLLSISRLPLALLFAYALWQGDALWLLIALIAGAVAMITDGLDGWTARRMGLVSDFGKLFDPLADAVFFVIAFAGYALAGWIPWWLALPFVVRELLQHLYLRPTAKRYGLAMGAKLIGKLKTVVQAFVVLFVVGLEWARLQGLVALDHRPELLYAILVGISASLSLGSIVPYIMTVASLQRAGPPPANAANHAGSDPAPSQEKNQNDAVSS